MGKNSWTMDDLKAKGIHVNGGVGKRLKEIKKVVTKVKKEAKKLDLPHQTPNIRVDIKPLSVNGAWQGKRFKTEAYKKYEIEVLKQLPKIILPKPPYCIFIEYGFSNKASDIDNPTKLILDILQKKYSFNDAKIYEAHLYKDIVPKGEEFFNIQIKHYKIK